MKKIILILSLLFLIDSAFSQTINGQWRGYFNDLDNNISLYKGNTEYVLELEINGETVSGTSYTYFENRRYFVICNLNGSFNKQLKKIIVNETERIKGSTPPDWSDCLQTHILYYKKQDGEEVLSGDWKSSPYNDKKNGGCGIGATTLSRRVLNNSIAFNKQNRSATPETKPIIKPTPGFKDKNPTVKPPVVKATPKIVNPTPNFKDKNPILKPPVAKTNPKTIKPAPVIIPKEKVTPKTITKIEEPAITKKPEEKRIINKPFEKRNSNIVKTIEIENETFKVDLYDNGDIDGDTISLFYNGKLLLSHKRLNDKAISLSLHPDNDRDVNELIMYAENLGSIPPNTALMVVTDGENRYEVRISSDLQKSGAIRFVYQPKKTQ
jgi:hypothetical protein